MKRLENGGRGGGGGGVGGGGGGGRVKFHSIVFELDGPAHTNSPPLEDAIRLQFKRIRCPISPKKGDKTLIFKGLVSFTIKHGVQFGTARIP